MEKFTVILVVVSLVFLLDYSAFKAVYTGKYKDLRKGFKASAITSYTLLSIVVTMYVICDQYGTKVCAEDRNLCEIVVMLFLINALAMSYLYVCADFKNRK